MNLLKLNWKKYTLIAISLVFLSMPFITAYAAYSPQDITFDRNENILRNTRFGNASPVVMTSGIINWILGILGLFAICLIIYAGFIWMWARGNEEEIKKAQEILKGAIIGLMIILASYGIASYVFENLLDITQN